jgi:hypothetical protein
MSPFGDDKLFFLMFQNAYDDYITYSDNLLTEPLTPTREKELELIQFFTEQFERIVSQITTQNEKDILDDLRELRDDCQEKYEELVQMYHLTLKPFRVFYEGSVLARESSRRPYHARISP